MEKKIPDYIHPAGYGKTTLAYLIDAALTVAMIFVLYYCIGPTLILPAQGYSEKYDAYTGFVKDSHLTVGDAMGTFLSYDAGMTAESGESETKAGYQKYQEAVTYYYTKFIPGNENAVFYEEDGVAKDADGSYNVDSVKAFVLKKVYALNPNGTPILDEDTQKPKDPYFVLDESTEDPYDVKLGEEYTGELDNVKLTLLRDYFFAEGKGVYYDAIAHLSAQPYFTGLQSELGMIRYLSFLPAFIISPFLFFFLIPLCVPNGKTIGKLIARTAVLGADGYKAKKLNIILHYAWLTIIWETLLIPNTAIGIMTLMLMLLIDYMALILSKNHQSLHDKVARTIVINSKESVWFADEETALAFAEAHPDSPCASFYRAKGLLSDPMSSAEEQAFLREESIVDLSTIGKAREKAKSIVSFDEFEAGEDKKGE